MLSVGDVFEGHYRILRILGHGGYATVYLGEHVEIQQRVAIKVMRENSERFTREGRVLARLSSPNVVRILGFGRTGDDHQYLISEWVDGDSLTDIMQTRDPLDWNEVREIAEQLLRGLAAAHEQGILHRDLKPDNVMIDRDGRVVMLDFGIAKVVNDHSLTKQGSIVGTPRFMAPERIRDDDEVGPPADLYSVGLICFGLLTGKQANTGRDVEAILLRHLSPEPYRFPTDTAVPIAAQRWVESLIAKMPTARPASADRALRDLPPPTTGALQVGPISDPERPTEAVLVDDRLERLRQEGLKRLQDREMRRSAREVPQHPTKQAELLPVPTAVHDAPSRGLGVVATLLLLIAGAGVGGAYWIWTNQNANPQPSQAASVQAQPEVPSAATDEEPAEDRASTSENPRVLHAKRLLDGGEYVESLRAFHAIELTADNATKSNISHFRDQAIDRIIERALTAEAEATTLEQVEAAAHDPLVAHSLYRAHDGLDEVVRKLRERAQQLK